jgi:hypothetical protein
MINRTFGESAIGELNSWSGDRETTRSCYCSAAAAISASSQLAAYILITSLRSKSWLSLRL